MSTIEALKIEAEGGLQNGRCQSMLCCWLGVSWNSE